MGAADADLPMECEGGKAVEGRAAATHFGCCVFCVLCCGRENNF